MSGRSKFLTYGLPVIGVATLVMGTGMVIKNRPVRPAETPPRQPTTAPSVAENIDASEFIGAIGISEPAGEAIAIAAHTAGVVESVEVEVGDAVAAGDVLFGVDTRSIRATIALRETQIELARADLASLRASIPPRRAAVTSAEASLASAHAGVLAAEADLADRRNLLRIAESVTDPRAIASEEVDRRRFAVAQAEARLQTARAAVAEAQARIAEAQAELARFVDPKSDADGPELIASKARIAQAERELDQTRADLALRQVQSPVSGRVLQVNVRPGEFAPASVPSEGLIVIGRDGPTHLRVEIDEVDIPRFRTDAKAWASPRGDASRRIDLTPILVEPLVVPKTNLSGRTSELVDTRVLQVVYALDDSFESVGVGQQFDVYIAAEGNES